METPKINPIHIMMAEDDDDDYFIFTIALQETSITFKISRAINGEVLMKLLQDTLPDVLFLDLQMPCKDGHNCLKEIRADKRYDALPIIVYSSMSNDFNIERCYRGGSNFYAVKPNSINDLKIMLEKILNIQWKTSLYYPPKSEFVLSANSLN